ncbi:MAG TPA: hypothetical protein VFX02_02020 [Gammaproteobacteria bacterium]|nr:hypothetical protein [Gammaproteobacteria bacterium]
MFKGYRVLAVVACLQLAACDTDLPSEGGNDFSPIGYAQPLSQARFESLSPEQQYQVANKLLGTLYKGIPVEDFLDLSGNLSDPELKTPNAEANFLGEVRDALNTDLTVQQINSVQQAVIDNYNFSDSGDERPKEEPLALIYESPLSRTSFVYWMAHFLANTIMFSPAEEMESTDIFDVQNTYKRLVSGLAEGHSVRQIIRSHLPSLQRWRVARTPENAGIEGFELYLGLFETIQDSKKVGKACKDFYLTGEDQDYLLTSTNIINTEPQIILKEDRDNDGTPETGGYFITSCDDFYDVLAGHPLIIPRACAVIASYLMAERTPEDRLAMCDSISSSGAATFEDIFKGILFSEQYLLHTERPKGFEETLISSMYRLKWSAAHDSGNVDRWVWNNMASDDFNRLYMGAMGWNTMTLKIGRSPEVPLDALSFANYHKAVREDLLMNDNSYEGGNSVAGLIYRGDGFTVRPEIEDMSAENYLHFLFLTALQRPASHTEISSLMTLLQSLGLVNGQQINGGAHDNIARVVFDYASRLAEFYYFKSI